MDGSIHIPLIVILNTEFEVLANKAFAFLQKSQLQDYALIVQNLESFPYCKRELVTCEPDYYTNYTLTDESILTIVRHKLRVTGIYSYTSLANFVDMRNDCMWIF